MGDTVGGRSSFGRGRKRKRQVSWAAAELLEEVKLFHMAKPVNPSLPPPTVDDAGEGDEDPANQPGLALLGLLGVESSSLSSPATPPPSATSPPALAPVAAAVNGGGGTSQQSLVAIAASTAPPSRESDWKGAPGSSSGISMSSSSAGVGVGAGNGGGGGVSAARAGGASRLFKGFEKTETVVRRKKQVAPPPPPPGTPPPLSPPREGAHMAYRYPKDIWPGHEPPNLADSSKKSVEGEEAVEPLEFFCDGCDETIPNGTERLECAVCPDEFCLCHSCFDEGEVLDKRHEHELLPSAASFHVTRAAPSAEAAAAAAQALHVTEAQELDNYNHDDLG